MTGHLYEGIKFSESADVHFGDIGESKCGTEGSLKHQYKKIEGKQVRATMGNAFSDDFVDRFYGKKQ